MVHHDFCFLLDSIFIAFHKGTQFLVRSFLVELWIILNFLGQLIVTADRGIVFQHVHDKALFYGLFHRVVMEGEMPNLSVCTLIG